MLVYEFKLKGKQHQYQAIDGSIRIGQFIRNKCLRYWMDAPKELKVNRFELNKYTKVLADDVSFPFVKLLNSMARQSMAERAWASISRFYDNCKKKVKGKKGFPRFKKFSRSVEYKTSGWKLSDDRKYLTITDKTDIGRLKLIGTHDLHFYQKNQIKRVRLVRRADGYYAQFCLDVNREEETHQTGCSIGLDVGLNHFYTDSNGEQLENPRFLRRSEHKLKRLQRIASKCTLGSNNRSKANNRLARHHLKVSRQRKDFAVKLARCVVMSNDIVAIENLNVKGLVKTKLAKSISDASWSQFSRMQAPGAAATSSMFRDWLDYFCRLFNKELIAVNPNYTSQDCSNCGNRVKKSLSTRTHICKCGCELDRDHNAAINILNRVGHTRINASGQINL